LPAANAAVALPIVRPVLAGAARPFALVCMPSCVSVFAPFAAALMVAAGTVPVWTAAPPA